MADYSQQYASIFEGTMGGIEGIWGLVTANKAKKEQENLMANYPKWEIPKSYKESLSIMGQLAQGNMPGYDLAKEGIQETSAQSLGEAKEGAMSSSQFQDTAARLNQQSLKAIRDLNIQNAQMKASAQKDFAGAKSAYGDLETQQWNQNINRLWNIKMEQASGKYEEGMSSAWSGMDALVQSGYNFAGNGSMSSQGANMGTSGGESGSSNQQFVDSGMGDYQNQQQYSPSNYGGGYYG